MLAAQHVARRFGERLAVEDLTFEVKRGEVFGLLGPNGAGKTTTLRMLGGLIAPSSGLVSIDGVAMTPRSGGALRTRIGFLTETPGLWEHLTAADNLAVYARLFGVADADRAVERTLRLFDLWDRRSDRALLLSKGMKQKLALARALVHNPEIVLLDEPTANLDAEAARAVRELLRALGAQGRVVVVSSHNLDEIDRVANRVALIRRSLVAVGEPSELRRQLFGRRVRIRFAGLSLPLDALASVAARAGAHDVRPEQHELSMALADPDRATPQVVRALVEAGAEVRAVFDEDAALEDVYLRLLGEAPPS
ncbi:MAG: ABC transporter ATP-binding protein [Vicinamibacterales bacterium]